MDLTDVEMEAEAKAEAARRLGTAQRLRPGRGGTQTAAKCIHAQRGHVEPPAARPCCPQRSWAEGDALRAATAGEAHTLHLSLRAQRGTAGPDGHRLAVLDCRSCGRRRNLRRRGDADEVARWHLRDSYLCPSGCKKSTRADANARQFMSTQAILRPCWVFIKIV